MKKILMVTILLLFVSVSYFVLSSNKIIYNPTDNISIISPYSKTIIKTSKLYFIDDSQLVSEMRAIKIEKHEEKSIIMELQKGPKIIGNISPISKNVTIISVETSDRVCFINLSNNFFAEEEDDVFYLNIIAITNSITQLKSIDYVQLLNDGKRVKRKVADIDVESIIASDLSSVQARELQQKDIVAKFLDNIEKGRYDLAYDLIDARSRVQTNYDDFTDDMIRMKLELAGYSSPRLFTKIENGNYMILVKYNLNRAYTQIDIMGIEEFPSSRELTWSWNLVEEYGIWKINYGNNTEKF